MKQVLFVKNQVFYIYFFSSLPAFICFHDLCEFVWLSEADLIGQSSPTPTALLLCQKHSVLCICIREGELVSLQPLSEKTQKVFFEAEISWLIWNRRPSQGQNIKQKHRNKPATHD